MKHILIAGAGKSSIYVIQYLLSKAAENGWKVIVADGSAQAISEKIKNHPAAEAAPIDITNSAERRPLVQRADIVVSLMPPQLHIHLAKDCLELGKNLITSSYISPEMREMDAAVMAAGLMFMCEMGLDPGIDHMSANEMIHKVKAMGGDITAFESYCGGLVAPESDDHPWHYKFSWNPINIINAGKDGARYLHEGKEVQIPYEDMFKDNATIPVNGLENLAWYANRNSLQYPDLYEVPQVSTFLRATLRHPDFCKGWEAVRALGLTDTTDVAERNGKSFASWTAEKAGVKSGDVRSDVLKKLNLPEGSPVPDMLEWLGLFENHPVPGGLKSSGEILLQLLLDKWAMQPEDKDMVVMKHELTYELTGTSKKLSSTMVLKGENREYSAMAKTVGMPMALLAEMVLHGQLPVLPTGVHIPNMPEVYGPLLTGLEHHGIVFEEEIN